MSIVGPLTPNLRSLRPITPINTPFPNITPFTLRDNATYIMTLDDIVKYIEEDIYPFVSENVKELADSWIDNATNLVDAVNVALETQSADVSAQITALNESVDAVVSSLTASVDNKIEELQSDVDAAVQQVVNSSIELQSSVLAGIVSDPASDGRTALDALYATIFKTVPIGQGDVEYVIRIKGASMGVTGNNQDYTPVVSAIVADIATQPNNAAAKIIFPRGQINLLPGNNLFADGRTYTLEGEGVNLTELRPHTSDAAGDLIDLRGQRSSIRNMTLNGRIITSGANAGTHVAPNVTTALVLNGPSQTMRDLRIIDFPGNGVEIGRDVSAIGWQSSGVSISGCKKIGLRVCPSTAGISNTDGQWIGGFIGQSGRANAVFEAASTTVTDLHSWGAGMMGAGLPAIERAGVVVKGRHVRFNTLESETNMGPGIYIDGSVDAKYLTFIGGHVWGNWGQGIVYNSTNNITVIGMNVNRNGVGNTGLVTNIAYSGIHNSGSTDIQMIGCQSWDNGASLNAIAAPAGSNNPYPGRGSNTQTQAYHYSESSSGCDKITAIGNKWRAQDVRDTLKPIDVSSPRFDSAGTDFGDWAVRNIQSAATITIPSTHNYFTVSGTVQITALAPGSVTGKPVKLLFTAGSPGGIVPADTTSATRPRLVGGTFTGGQFSSIDLLWTDNGWVEVSRSVK